jgi:hypothetical protein
MSIDRVDRERRGRMSEVANRSTDYLCCFSLGYPDTDSGTPIAKTGQLELEV